MRAACANVLWIVLFTLLAVVRWRHVWTGHPSSTLTRPCGDPAQEVWFTNLTVGGDGEPQGTPAQLS
jgi:hypothetical protein